MRDPEMPKTQLRATGERDLIHQSSPTLPGGEDDKEERWLGKAPLREAIPKDFSKNEGATERMLVSPRNSSAET